MALAGLALFQTAAGAMVHVRNVQIRLSTSNKWTFARNNLSPKREVISIVNMTDTASTRIVCCDALRFEQRSQHLTFLVVPLAARDEFDKVLGSGEAS